MRQRRARVDGAIGGPGHGSRPNVLLQENHVFLYTFNQFHFGASFTLPTKIMASCHVVGGL